MDKETIEGKLVQIISERLEINKEIITSESNLRNDLGIDSFGLAELSFEIKDKFKVNVEDKDIPLLIRVKDAVNYIYKRIKEC